MPRQPVIIELHADPDNDRRFIPTVDGWKDLAADLRKEFAEGRAAKKEVFALRLFLALAVRAAGGELRIRKRDLVTLSRNARLVQTDTPDGREIVFQLDEP